MYIKSKKYKDLPQPEIYLQEQLMTFVDYEKYLGVVMSDNCTNDRDITRQMRSLYARGNLIIRNFKHCSNEVKIQLFKTFCSNMYCGHLWSSYFSYSYSKIRVAFNQIYRCLMKLDRRSSISQSMLIFDIDNFDIIIRKAVYNFRERLKWNLRILWLVLLLILCFFNVALHSEGGIKYYFNLVTHIPRLIIPSMF